MPISRMQNPLKKASLLKTNPLKKKIRTQYLNQKKMLEMILPALKSWYIMKPMFM